MITIPIETIIRKYYQFNPNGHWFDHDTLYFFRSKTSQYGEAETVDGPWYFISSEKQTSIKNEYPRLYTIRVLSKKGTMSSIGEFQQFKSSKEAKRYLKTYLKGEVK